MIHIIITIQSGPPEIVFHKFASKFTTAREKTIDNVLTVYLTTWLRKKATEFGARFRQVA